ncbi:glycoside hydrolase family 73 protein [Sporolactobacillus sp. KGMB 08714]|uniref:glycoside hydrolase family 73 protein n=1 Tax=Sporolactobacillus sp. KGMB 08714 TaxID=3064704 RepID=UPI002FBE37AF
MSENGEKKNASARIGYLGKPLLILSAMTTLSVPGVALAAGSQQKTTQTVATGKVTTDSDGSDDVQNQKTTTSATGTETSAAANSGETAASSSSTASEGSSATNASSEKAAAGSSTATSANSGTAASTTGSTASSAAAAVQNNVDPTEPNKVTNNVGSSEKTVSQSTVANTNIQTIQAPQANFTAVQSLASTSSVTQQFISEIGSEAQQIASANNLYASVMIAQAILESGSGQSGLATQANNLFGIKGTYNGQYVTMNTAEYVNGQYVEVAAYFRKYPSLSASLEDYASLLKNGLSYNSSYYAKVWKSNAPTYQDATQALQGTYATDPTYASKLDALISEYDLTKYDSNSSASGTSGSSASGSTSSTSSTGSSSTGSSASASTTGTVGSTVSTNGILYVSSDASTPVKTSLTTVTISRIYSSAVNKYQVSHNGVIVGYLRTLSSSGTSGSSSTGSSASASTTGTVGSTVSTNGILYASSDASTPVKTSLTTVTISRIYSSAVNKYQVSHNGVIVGYLRTLSSGTSGSTTSSSASTTTTGKVGSTVSTNGILYVSSDASTPVKTSLTTVTISRIYSSAVNKYQVSHNGVIVGYLRTLSSSGTSGSSSTGSSASASTTGTVGSTVSTNGILYASSDASTPVKTSLTTVTISRIYSSAVNKYQVSRNGVIVGYLRKLSSSGTSGSSSTGSSASASTTGTVGSTVSTNGILYASSDASTSVKTSLTTVTISRIYSSAANKYQVSHNGVIVGYLRTLSSSGSGTAAATSSATSQSSSSAVKVGTTVNTNGVIYLSSTSTAPLITYLTKVQVSKIFPSALNKYQVEINGVIVGYLRFASASSSSSAGSITGRTVGTKIATNGILYVSSDASTPVKTSLTAATISKIFANTPNPYQVEVNGTIVGYLQ